MSKPTYTRINFENGILVSPAKVTIESETYDVTPSVKSGTTPANAQTMNILDKGIKDLYDYVLPNSITYEVIEESEE